MYDYAMKLIKFNGKELSGFRKKISASCVVRNEINGWRKKDQVVYTIPKVEPGKVAIPEPYQPRQFPEGIFKILEVIEIKDKNSEYYPYFIKTTATQKVSIWALDDNDCYSYKTDKDAIDTGYGIHYTKSSTTLGCIRPQTEKDIRYLVSKIKPLLDKNNEIYIEARYT